MSTKDNALIEELMRANVLPMKRVLDEHTEEAGYKNTKTGFTCFYGWRGNGFKIYAVWPSGNREDLAFYATENTANQTARAVVGLNAIAKSTDEIKVILKLSTKRLL